MTRGKRDGKNVPVAVASPPEKREPAGLVSMGGPGDARRRILFGFTILSGAGLLFCAEPMFARQVLPTFGGAPAVWNTCLVFYQAALLGGYAYAHWSTRRLRLGARVLLHCSLLAGALVFLPFSASGRAIPFPGSAPPVQLLILLAKSIGLPFLLVSATAPLLQALYAESGARDARDPYFLYAASNAGSLGGLLAYPFLVEPRLSIREQGLGWTATYAALGVLVALCGWTAARPPNPAESGESEPDRRSRFDVPPTWRTRIRWMALSAAPSALMIANTTHITTDIVSMPLLWTVPLSLYLISFILAFSKRGFVPLRLLSSVQAVLALATAATFFLYRLGSGIPVDALPRFALHLAFFFATALLCHERLAEDRPAVSRLTEFFFCLSGGGVIGGLLCALVAPLVFRSGEEYPILIAVACAIGIPPPIRTGIGNLRLGLPLAGLGGLVVAAEALRSVTGSIGDGRYWFVGAGVLLAATVVRRPVRFGIAILGLVILGAACSSDTVPVLHRARSFFGILRVEHFLEADANRLLHGSTTHGLQSRDPEHRREAWGYYHAAGPLGSVFTELESRPGFRSSGRIGVVGLGTGAVAAYGLPGQRIVFYEIDAVVLRIARDDRYFTYLADSRAAVTVKLGDARLRLAEEPPSSFDLLVMDAFSSDSIPVHLLTVESVAADLALLGRGGLLAFHISNRYLDLEPVLAGVASRLGVSMRVRVDMRPEQRGGRLNSVWAVLARTPADFGRLDETSEWRSARLEPRRRVWTDDYSSVVTAIDWTRIRRPPAEARRPDARDDRGLQAGAEALDLWRKGDVSGALDGYQRAVAIAPSDPVLQRSLGAILLESGRPAEAVLHFRRAVELDPGSGEAEASLGNGLWRTGKRGEGLDHLRRAVELDPRNLRAVKWLAESLAESDQPAEAEAQYLRAIALDPIDPRTHHGLGLALCLQGKLEGGIAAFREAVRLDPSDRAAREDLALAERSVAKKGAVVKPPEQAAGRSR